MLVKDLTNHNFSHIPQFCVSITQQAETADGADVYWNRQIITAWNCQARVQVPNPLSQQAPNPDPKVRPSLENPKTQFFGLGWHNNHMGHHPTTTHP